MRPKKAVCKVIVSKGYAPKVSIKKNLTITEGQSSTLKISYSSKKYKLGKTYWSSSDSSVAYVNSNGKITTYKPGSATITLTYKNGKKTLKYYCNVTVKENVYYDYTFADVTGDTFEYGGPGLCIHKLQYNGNDLEIVAICKNNRMFYADYFDYVTLRVYDYNSEKTIAKYRFTDVPIHLNAYDEKYMYFTIPASYVNVKNYDLRNNEFGMEYEYYYYYTY